MIVGHDWGAPIAWNSALLRPDVFRAVAGLSVPYAPPGDTRPTDAFRRDGRRRGVLHRVLPGARPGRGRDRADVRGWLLGFYFTASGDAPPPAARAGTVATIPHGAQMQDRFSYPDPLPAG